ncbi:MAG: TIGR04076 family protein [Bacteroidetes bacterium]|nr:TIGR04076 family protein [Bacteroidota bacterium]
MTIDERFLRIIQKRFNYSDDEVKKFADDPRNEELLSLQKKLSEKIIVLEVVRSKGCNSNHNVGDKFYFDAFGNLLTGLCPKKICSYSLNSALMMVYTANEMLYAGIDPNTMRFKRSSCFDVGINCGGWGNIVLELSVKDKNSVLRDNEN